MSFITRKIFWLSAALAGLAGFAQPASAQFVSLGATKVQAALSCVQYGEGGAICATLGFDSKVAVNRYDAGAWSGWSTVGNVVASKPSCVSVAKNRALCATRHATGALATLIYNGTWSGQRLTGDGIASRPSCAGYVFGGMICVAKNAAGGLRWVATDGKEFSEFTDLAGTVTNPPNCTSDTQAYSPRNVICAYGNQNGRVFVRRFDGTAVTAALDLGGQTGREVLCTHLGPGAAVAGKATCAGVGTNSSTFPNVFSGGAFTAANWSGFFQISGTSSSLVSCAPRSANNLTCGTLAVDNAGFYVLTTTNGTFSAYSFIGGTFTGDPSCFPLVAGKVMCVMVGIDGEAKSWINP